MGGIGPDSLPCVVQSSSGIVTKELWCTTHHATLRDKLVRARAELVVMQVAEGLVQHRHDFDVQEVSHQLAALESQAELAIGAGAASSVRTQPSAQPYARFWNSAGASTGQTGSAHGKSELMGDSCQILRVGAQDRAMCALPALSNRAKDAGTLRTWLFSREGRGGCGNSPRRCLLLYSGHGGHTAQLKCWNQCLYHFQSWSSTPTFQQ